MKKAAITVALIFAASVSIAGPGNDYSDNGKHNGAGNGNGNHYGTASSIPEPGTAGLMIVAGSILYLTRKRS